MSDITIEELEKAARNIERISAFIGERRDWIVGDGGESKATAIRGSARALATMIAEKSGIEPDPDPKLTFPKKLEPSAKISAARLAKFGDFLDQLQAWFFSQKDAEFPENSGEAAQSTHAALVHVCAAVDSILTPVKTPEPPPPKDDDPIGEIDHSPILEVDTTARLVLEDDDLKPLTQTFQGITELTVGAKQTLNDFLAKQSVKIEDRDLRRLQDRMLKWIEGVPLGQVLVIKLSGLTGKPNIYSSYQPKGGIPVREEVEDS